MNSRLERSDLVNQLGTISSWGVALETAAGRARGVEAWSSGPATAWRMKSGLITADNAFAKASVHLGSSAAFCRGRKAVWLTYAHNPPNCRGRSLPEDSYYSGLGARDVAAVDWVMSRGKFSMVTELMPGVSKCGGTSLGENVYGLAVLPSRFSPDEGVPATRPSHGRDAGVTPACSRGDHLSQMGQHDEPFTSALNYYFFPEDPTS